MIEIKASRTNGLMPASTITSQGGVPAPALPKPPANGRVVQGLDFAPRFNRIMAAIDLSRKPAG